jgi:hypothetical protein
MNYEFIGRLLIPENKFSGIRTGLSVPIFFARLPAQKSISTSIPGALTKPGAAAPGTPAFNASASSFNSAAAL